MASAGPSGSSRDSPMTRMRISVSSRMGTSEQRRRKKLWAAQGEVAQRGPRLHRPNSPAPVRPPCLGPCPPAGSLAVTLGRPVVPLVVGLGLLREEHLMQAVSRVGPLVRTHSSGHSLAPPVPMGS